MQVLGVHSEVGKLRTVMVCRPGLAHQRLTSCNAPEMLFDDVLWVHEAQLSQLARILAREAGTTVAANTNGIILSGPESCTDE